MKMTCNQCGWVAFGVTREHAVEEVARFNAYFDGSPPEVQEMFGNRRSDVSHYTFCHRCGGEKFHDSEAGDCPAGCTLSPIIVEGA